MYAAKRSFGVENRFKYCASFVVIVISGFYRKNIFEGQGNYCYVVLIGVRGPRINAPFVETILENKFEGRENTVSINKSFRIGNSVKLLRLIYGNNASKYQNLYPFPRDPMKKKTQVYMKERKARFPFSSKN